VEEPWCILDDGTAATRPWVGRHSDEAPVAGAVLVGIDPREILGLS
jgi:hypothetical protein